MPNRLSQETSPYLKQHAENPVEWYPWGEEALARARSEDKPILLSVGYSACHWCHVMAHESFENPQIAALMNERFVNIKVDREERPDLDQIYQNVSQLMTRSGGWPLTVFLTPDLRPYFGGTYFPPEDRHGRPGFPRVLVALSDAYRIDRENVNENARRLTEAIGQLERNRVPETARPTAASLRKLADAILSGFDWQNGGFGGAPKFPNTVLLTFLWRFGQATGIGMAQDAVLHALTKMAEGGIQDHIGGGFHRYTVDGRWGVPHFEKMLYDNALLLKLYAEALISGGDGYREETRALHRRALAETTRYVLREMRSPEGGFYSAQDADSEGVEGKFFTWNPKSLREVLTENEARLCELRFGVTEAGNFEVEGETVLRLASAVADVARAVGTDASSASQLLEGARAKLFAAREKRVHPGRDDKVIAAWNGLMISGLAWASRALRLEGETALADSALAAANSCFSFAQTRLAEPGARLKAVYNDGKARFNAYLDDYAFLALGALDLARVTEEPGAVGPLVAAARDWVDVARTRFADPEGGFHMTSDDHEKLLVRPKTVFDQAIPAGNGILIECLLALGELFPEAPYAAEAEKHLSALYATAEKAPMGMGATATAALLYVQGPVTVCGTGAAEACTNAAIFQKAPDSPDAGPAARQIVVCHRRACDQPQTHAQDARALAVKKTHVALGAG